MSSLGNKVLCDLSKVALKDLDNSLVGSRRSRFWVVVGYSLFFSDQGRSSSEFLHRLSRRYKVRSPSRSAEGRRRSFVNQVLAGVTQLFVRSWA